MVKWEAFAARIVATEPSAVLHDLRNALDAAKVAPLTLEPGRERVEGLRANLQIRRMTAKQAGIMVTGLDDALAKMTALDAGEHILSFHFSGPDRFFTVFVNEADATVVGAIEIVRSRTDLGQW